MGAPGRLLGLRRAAARLAAGLAKEGPEEADLERVLRSRAKAARERRIQRLMEPPRPPERTLTRQAMEQIRYLGREWPEEWPVARLAGGFQVSPDVVCRVLRSRFAPSPQRAAKQDARAAAAAASAGRVQGPPAAGQRRPGRQAERLPVSPEAASRLLPAAAAAAAAASELGWTAGRRKPRGGGRGTPVEEESGGPLPGLQEEEEEGERSALAPVQSGREFFDREGNFLYRIPEESAREGAASPGGGGQEGRRD